MYFTMLISILKSKADALTMVSFSSSPLSHLPLQPGKRFLFQIPASGFPQIVIYLIELANSMDPSIFSMQKNANEA